MAAKSWPARRSLGGDAAAWVASALLFGALAAVFFGGSREVGIGMLVLCVVAAVLAAVASVLVVLALAYRRLAYALTDTALCIEWLGRTDVVPYHAIQGIYTGQRLSGHATPAVPNWPGVHVGRSRVRGLGHVRFFATSSDLSLLTLITVEHGGVVVSARDPHAFRAALIERVEASQEAAAGAPGWHQTPPTTAPWTSVTDAWLPICAAAGTLVVLVVLAVISFRFDSLPALIALHFDVTGRPNDLAPRSDLLRLPLLGLTCLVVNWAIGVRLHPHERLLARLLWIGGAVVQLILLVGVLRIVA
ncbi:MAG: PH domain-containing protein [Chloroflexota bacterium]|nr:PH domain-containing protein [Chloroflexota bacterium]